MCTTFFNLFQLLQPLNLVAWFCSYEARLGDAQQYGIKKAVYSGGSMGAVWFIIYSVYALAFWYGIKLTIDEPQNYTGGQVLIVSPKRIIYKSSLFFEINIYLIFVGFRYFSPSLLVLLHLVTPDRTWRSLVWREGLRTSFTT